MKGFSVGRIGDRQPADIRDVLGQSEFAVNLEPFWTAVAVILGNNPSRTALELLAVLLGPPVAPPSKGVKLGTSIVEAVG